MSVTDRIVEGFKATLGARIVRNVANGLLLILLARVLLTPDEYGLLYLVISIIAVAQLGADLGIGRSAARFVSERKESAPSTVPYILRTSLRYRLVLIGVVAAGLVVGRNLIADVLDEPALSSLLLLGVLYMIFGSVYAYYMAVFQGFNRVDLSAKIEVVNNVARLLLVVALTALGLGVAGALFGYIVGAVLGTIVGSIYLYRRYRSYDDSGGDRSLRNRLLKYSVPLTATHSASVIDNRVDTVLVAYFVNPVAVSYYVLSKQISEFVMMPASSLGFSVSPTYGEQKANESLDHAARIYERTLEYVFLLYIPAAVGVFLVADPALTLLFGSEYAGAVPVLQVFGVYMIFQAVTKVTTNGLDYLGRANARAVAKGSTAVANAGLNLVLIPLYGATGAAVATVITYGTYTLANVYVMHGELSLDLARIGRSFVLTSAIAGAMGLSVLFLVPYASNIPALVAVIAAGVAVWGALVTISGMVDPRETIAQLT